MLKTIFGSKRSKAQNLIKSCYPEDDGGVIQQNLAALIKFAVVNPHKLTEIGQYIQKRTVTSAIPKNKVK